MTSSPSRSVKLFGTEAPLSARQRVADLATGPVFYAGPGILTHLRFQALPPAGPDRDVSLDWTDEAPPAGEHAYYVRVLQLDGHLAWSSPTWVTVA